jgi:hypothetical protein
MRRLSFIMGGITTLAAIALLPILIRVYRDYPLVQGLACCVIAAVLIGCALVFVVGATREYEFNILVPPINALIGLIAFLAFSWMRMLLTLLLAMTTIASRLAMNREWRTEST